LSKINQKQSLFPETVPPPLVPVSGGLGHVSHGRFQAEWAASLEGTLTASGKNSGIFLHIFLSLLPTPNWAKSNLSNALKHFHIQLPAGRVVQVVEHQPSNHEFKPQYQQNKTKQNIQNNTKAYQLC
jgi:hypothetical protein